jgi:hypothetical protein
MVDEAGFDAGAWFAGFGVCAELIPVVTIDASGSLVYWICAASADYVDDVFSAMDASVGLV